jgi:Zn-finger nucleic acid-binding protein
MEEQEAVLGYKPDPTNAPAASNHKPRRAYIPCSECGKLMNPKNFSGCSGIVMDWCRNHGCWFDRNELQQIVLFIRNGGLRKAREHEQFQLKEQEDRVRREEFALAALERRLGGTLMETSPKEDPLLQLFGKTFLE